MQYVDEVLEVLLDPVLAAGGHGELVAPETADDAVRSGPLGQALAGGGECGVPGGVAVGVVEALEVVEVDQADDRVVVVAGQEAPGAVLEGGATLGAGEGVTSFGGQAPVELIR